MVLKQLEEFFNYKNRLIEDILTNPNVVRLITNDVAQRRDPISLVYDRVFPYENLPDTAEDAKTYICCDVDIQKSINKNLLVPTIYIWVFTHESLARLPEGGVRVDKLCSEIANTISGSHHYGIGALDLSSTRRFAPINDFLGKVMTFQTLEHNRPGPNPKPIPANRRRG